MYSNPYFIRTYANELQDTLANLPWSAINDVVRTVFDAWTERKTVFVMGNGGSAATALHMAADLSKNTAVPGFPRLRAVSFNDNMALFSALGNDTAYDQVFREQVLTYVDSGDVVIAISASGNSPNVLNAVTAARDLGATTIGFSGYYGGKLAGMVDIPVVVPNHSIEQIEDVHMILEHMVTASVRQAVHQAVKRAV
ncbi:MAG: phosphoheptose isomerase [Chloroflexota bacterium]|nr:SIS domain-containing protein [Caldilinea sp.]GIK71288.1 MAG: phosphoheptose isomerase [Chloroflexota bacterium]